MWIAKFTRYNNHKFYIAWKSTMLIKLPKNNFGANFCEYLVLKIILHLLHIM